MTAWGITTQVRYLENAGQRDRQTVNITQQSDGRFNQAATTVWFARDLPLSATTRDDHGAC